MAITRSELQVLLTLNDQASAKIRASLGTIDKNAKNTTRTVTTMGQQLRMHWLAAAAALTGVVLVMRKVIGTAIEFESAFAGVRKTVNATEAEFAQLSQGIRDMSKVIPVAAKDLAGIMEIAGQLGVTGVADLEKFTETVAKIAVTTNLTKEAAATSFARIANVMKLPLQEVDRMGAAIVDLGNNFATTEAEIATFAQRISGAGAVAGLTTQDLFGFGAAFSSVGVKAERGGTAVSKALIMMGSAVANGGEQLDQFANIAGLTSKEFITAYQDNAAKAFALFIEGLGKSGLKGAAILKELELGDQRLVQAFLSVGGASGILTNAIEMSNAAYEKNTALNEEAAKRFGTTASQIQIFKNNVDDLMISLGTNLFPAIVRVTEILTVLINKLSAVGFAFEMVRTGGQMVWEGILIGAEMVVSALAGMIAQLERIPIVGNMFTGMSEGLNTLVLELQAAKLAAQEVGDQFAANAANHLANLNQEQAATTAFAAHQMKTDALLAESKKVLEKTVTATTKEAAMKQMQSVATQASATASALTGFLAQAQGEGEKYKNAIKAVNIATAIMNTALAITSALTTQPFVPVGLAMGVLAAAQGALQIATIAAAAEGGTITRGGATLIGEKGPEIVDFPRGARITPLVDGGASPVTGGISVNIENASFREDQDIEEVFFRISDLLEEKRRGHI